jgi:hypothetical protein
MHIYIYIYIGSGRRDTREENVPGGGGWLLPNLSKVTAYSKPEGTPF